MNRQDKSAPSGIPDQDPRHQDPRHQGAGETCLGENPAADDAPGTDHDAAGEDLNDTKHDSLADIGRKKMHKR